MPRLHGVAEREGRAGRHGRARLASGAAARVPNNHKLDLSASFFLVHLQTHASTHASVPKKDKGKDALTELCEASWQRIAVDVYAFCFC